ncbi:phosphate/phosphite/phosphonate ABC transporter substrate-binding protein [Cupriavidus plantarum]|uniref:phosphate/phosphite/phosphonate ABC transporter substrate-binding protein n=1 Tax=Cupriavidus plantarum TaxID=942865 RepID=UPI000EB4C6FD|nr:PhnD/SsuA/transferrin family substrate-binding protein [Cupriavidus plantarum]RLK39284.1 ABC-type phosphate/phosphonate transport system substrate-binding protein [Cupriavidus plantarum]
MASGIASFRMYNATPAVAAAWRALFTQVFEDLRWPVEVIPHAWPAPLTDLWQRRDLVCGFMCGLPFVRGAAPVVPLVAPVLHGHARYRSEVLVRAESGWRTMEDAFGSRFGWMAEHSQSGYHAARRALSSYAHTRETLFGASIGPLDTPARTLEALRTRQIDVTALDSFYLDLLRRHAPETLAGLQTIAVTPWTPNPLLVAAGDVPVADREALVSHLVAIGDAAAYRALLDDVCIDRFVVPDIASYGVLLDPVADYPAIR